ncbi:Mannose-1-phosphate guanylyltransferase 1 [Zea mays]|uniref:Mannose-1-phosphate guanylyltransferase 1 n=1 Tax=Zea mays TaxID=4577 RepID=A0A1D6JRK3_MAIZE|nr:Mannose-1-phosphate guanylyltransferase 1 [Zea mays]
MAGYEQRVVAVIMVGGPTKGTRFRPLSLNVPKPLFPIAGQPMVHHPISACSRIPNLAQIYLIGFYDEREFALYVSSISNELRIPVRFVSCPHVVCFCSVWLGALGRFKRAVSLTGSLANLNFRYLREDKPHGSAGGLYIFRDYIMEDSPSHIVLLNCDVCSSFPLPDMLAKCITVFIIVEAHKKYGGMGTLLVNKVSAESANQFGELVADPETNELLHYTEKPETFVSDLINCGVYIFTPNIFSAIEDVLKQKKDRANLRRVSSFEALHSATKALPPDFVRLDQDILSPRAGKKELYTYQTLDFWEQIKTPGMSLRCSGLYLSRFRRTSPHLLASGDGKRTATIVGDVYIHPSAKVHPTSKIGPNVSISANARVGAGARLINCIILDGVEIMENAVVIHSIVGWKSSIGKWSRVQASFSLPFHFYHQKINESSFSELRCLCCGFLAPVLTSMPSVLGEGDQNAKLGITILGEAVDVEDEVVIVNSIVLPNKTLNVSVQEEIIL